MKATALPFPVSYSVLRCTVVDSPGGRGLPMRVSDFQVQPLVCGEHRCICTCTSPSLLGQSGWMGLLLYRSQARYPCSWHVPTSAVYAARQISTYSGMNSR